ncbi:MAG: glycosyltransferase family 2 protein [Flavobacteriaceae bacterium]|nr:glycosyltransferase family 2 protein [Flavobacteriaceae bacterium]
MKDNLVSIITPMYNSAKYVGKTIESVLAQTYSNWEMLIVDDGSKDNSAEIVQQYVDKDSRVKLIRQKNGGCASARNNALSKARGRYVCFLDSDDLWEKDFLFEQIRFMKEKNASFVYSSHKRIDEGNIEILVPFIVPEKVSYVDLLKTCSVSTLTVMIDKEEVEEVKFDENLRNVRDDYALWLELIKQTKVAYGNKKILASYRILQGSATRNKKKVAKAQFKIYFQREKLGLVKSLYYLAHWAINGFLKYRK